MHIETKHRCYKIIESEKNNSEMPHFICQFLLTKYLTCRLTLNVLPYFNRYLIGHDGWNSYFRQLQCFPVSETP